MCGIAGVLDLAGRPADDSVIRAISGAMSHRGPDDEGYHLEGSVALGVRRLAILDVAGGRQPMANEDDTVWVTFNGEIYNFQELRGRLKGLGHRFRTRSDTEVIVHGYEQWGAACVREFRGMFAFGLWDAGRRSLLLARDRVGKKPLYYARTNSQWVFASELQALLRHPAVAREVDWTALDDYLTYGYVPAPRTIFRGVHKLPPAHYLTITADGVAGGEAHLERYWELEYGPKLKGSEASAAEGLLEVLTEAVRLRLIADVPLGALLSGGLDSSMVVALMSRLSARPVKTFSVGFEEAGFDELPYARLVAERYGTEHHEFVVRPETLDALPLLVRHYGEPFADSSAIPTYQVAKLTRGHVKVALNGDGGDECLAGYERYAGSLAADRYQGLPAPLRARVIEPLGRLMLADAPRRSWRRKLDRFLRVASLPAARRYLRWVGYLSPDDKRALYTPEFRLRLGSHEGEQWLVELFEQAKRRIPDGLDRLMFVDVNSYLPHDLLVKMDIATMAASLEARSPFLDHKVMEFCAALPARDKLRRMTTKPLLRKVAARFLPRETLSRPKMGFGVPVGSWIRGELRPWLEEVLLSPRALKRGYFEPGALRELVQTHLDGHVDRAFALWALLWLELWHREFLD